MGENRSKETVWESYTCSVCSFGLFKISSRKVHLGTAQMLLSLVLYQFDSFFFSTVDAAERLDSDSLLLAQ